VTSECRIRSLRALHFQKNYQVGLTVSTSVLSQSLSILSSDRCNSTSLARSAKWKVPSTIKSHEAVCDWHLYRTATTNRQTEAQQTTWQINYHETNSSHKMRPRTFLCIQDNMKLL